MNKNSIAFPWLGTLTVGGILIFNVNQVLAQVTPDNTLGDESSVVNTRDATSDSIDGGAIRGQNLFHSFEEFNVGEDRGVYFSNPDDVNNIFSRVTGNNVSNILGTLGVDGAANLFLINPNGIVFGEGASLDVQGSFAATTADGIEFGEQGFFGVSNPESPPLLTINPSAYLFNQVAPGAIANSSQASADFNASPSFDDGFFGLRVPDNQNLLLLGGDVNVDGGGLVASGGRIDIGAVTGEGVVGLNNNGSLNIPDSISRGNVSLTNGAGFLVAGDGGGDIAIAAKDIRIDSASSLNAGILSNLGSSDAQAGDITINAAGSLTLTNDSQISSSTFGRGNAGSVNIFAGESVTLNNGNNGTFIFNNVDSNAIGDSQGVNITTSSLFVNNGAQIQSLTRGEGNSGKIVINASNTVSFDGTDASNSPSGAYSIVLGGKGNSGGIDVFARSLSITNRAQLNGDTRGVGDAGDINIQVDEYVKLVNSIIIAEITEGAGIGKGGDITIKTGSLLLQDGSSLLADTENIGNAGDINIEAREKVILEGEGPAALDPNQIVESQITATVDSFEGSRGKGGSINISTPFLSVADGGFIRTSTFGLGNAGNVKIDADNISVDGFASDGSGSFIASEVNAVDEIKAVGNGGDVEIVTDNLSVTNGAVVSVSTFGDGDAGNLSIFANNIKIDGGENGFLTGFFASVEEEATGQGGSINIGSLNVSAQQLTLNNGGQIVANTFSQGDAGDLSIFANNVDISGQGIFSSGLFAEVREDATGQGGSISIGSEQSFAERLNVTNGAEISVSSLGEGKAGELGISANALNLDNNAVISSQSKSTFEAGDITLNIANSLQAKDSEISTSSTQSSGGNLTITAGDIKLRGDSDITTSIFSGEGSGGNIAIEADAVIAFDDSDIFASAPDGKGGDITLDTPAYFGENFTLNSLTSNPDTLQNNSRADVNATGAVSGSVSIPDVSFIQNSLNNLPDDSINTDELVANSCVVPVSDRGEGKFIITGTESLPVRPGDGIPSKFPTGEVRSVPEKQRSWQPGDPIVEPQGAYRLANGKLVLSRECN